MGALKIRVTRDGEEIKTFGFDDLHKSELLVGRSSDADIRLDDRAIGRSHAAFKTVEDKSNVIELQRLTKFGKLLLNGKDVSENVMVSPGDVIRIADYEMSVEAGGKSAVAAKQKPVEKAQEIKLETTNPPATEAVVLTTAAPTSDENPTGDGAAVSEDEKTSFVALAKLQVFLTFKPGHALIGEQEVTEFEMKSDEIVLGRGTQCDVILTDKKASRKHCSIVRAGASYSIKDLDSGNGTLVNGEEISLHELSSGDVIRVGDSEFSFKAMNVEYSSQEQKGDFLQVEHQQELAVSEEMSLGGDEIPSLGGDPVPQSMELGLQNQSQSFENFQPNEDMIPPPPQPQNVAPKSLMAKFRALPKSRQSIVAIILVLGLWALSDFLDEDTSTAKKAQKETQSLKALSPQEQSFRQLAKEKRDFVLQTYQIVLDQMNHRDFDGALNNLEKIFAIAPNFTYKDARELAEVAKKGRELLVAQEEEEKRKKEEDERKKKITELEHIAQSYFDKDQLVEMEGVFVRILELDPENSLVTKLKGTLDERSSKKRIEEEEKAKFEAMRKLMRDVIADGNTLLTQERYYDAMDKWAEVPGAGTDETIIQEAKALIEKAKTELQSKRDPHIQTAKTSFEAKEYMASRQEYNEALRIDPRCTECREGIKRIQRDVHERAQRVYIEAIMAESVSDLTLAKKKYLECYKASIPEDDYYGRCWRKYYRFVTIDSSQETTQELDAAGVRAPASSVIDDNYTDQVLENF